MRILGVRFKNVNCYSLLIKNLMFNEMKYSGEIIIGIGV